LLKESCKGRPRSRELQEDRLGVVPAVEALEGRELTEFFSRYQKIVCRNGGADVSRSDIRPFDNDSVLVIIGRNEHASVVVKPSDDTVHELDATREPPPWLEAPLPTIWHWILWVDYRLQRSGLAGEGPSWRRLDALLAEDETVVQTVVKTTRSW
jgi:hypothetical protein